MDFPELKRVLSSLAEQWKSNAILVENRASGQSLIQELKLSTVLPIIAIKVDSDKQARAQAVTPLIEAGKVFLPESAPWRNDFIDELSSFPAGAHDDAVDSTTQALNYLRERSSVLPTIFLMPRSFDSTELDGEALWDKVNMGLPLTEAEIDRLP